MKVFNGWLLTMEYGLAFIFITAIIIFFIPYYRKRLQSGVISALMLAGLMFFVAYDIKMLTGLWIRVSGLVYDINPAFRELQTTVWGVAQGLVVISIIIISYLVFTRKYDLWFYLKKVEPDKSKVIETVVDDYMKEEDINSTTIHKLGKEDDK